MQHTADVFAAAAESHHEAGARATARAHGHHSGPRGRARRWLPKRARNGPSHVTLIFVSNCPGCGDLPDELLVETGKGDSFPAPIGRLEKMVEGVGSGGRLLTCSHCSAFFVWQDIPQVYGSGWLDEEKLTRLPPNESELLARFFAGTLEDVEDLLAGLGVPLARFVLTSCALSSADPGRVRRLVPALVRRHLQGDTTLDAVLSQYMDVSIAATEDVLAACKALPVHPTTDELVLRCKKKLKSLKAALARNR